MLILLFGFWILLNGQWTLEIALTGLVLSVLLYAFLCAFLGYSPKKEWAIAKLLPRGCAYIAWLVCEIFRSAFRVIHFIWTPKELVEPKLLSFESGLKEDGTRVLLANSITLTPGTITVSMDGGKFLIHTLDSSLAEGMEDCEMVRRVRELEGGNRA